MKKCQIPWNWTRYHATRYLIQIEMLRLQGSNGLKKTSCDVGMHFDNFRIYSVKIGEKSLDVFRKMPDEPGVFRKASETFFYFPILTDISRRLPKYIIHVPMKRRLISPGSKLFACHFLLWVAGKGPIHEFSVIIMCSPKSIWFCPRPQTEGLKFPDNLVWQAKRCIIQ